MAKVLGEELEGAAAAARPNVSASTTPEGTDGKDEVSDESKAPEKEQAAAWIELMEV